MLYLFLLTSSFRWTDFLEFEASPSHVCPKAPTLFKIGLAPMKDRYFAPKGKYKVFSKFQTVKCFLPFDQINNNREVKELIFKMFIILSNKKDFNFDEMEDLFSMVLFVQCQFLISARSNSCYISFFSPRIQIQFRNRD